MAGNEAVETNRPLSLVEKIWDAIAKDGHIAAMGRQGADEMGIALKAFPDSISIDEPGTLWNPTQGEIAADREVDRLPSPSEIGRNKSPYEPEHHQDNGNGMER
jgi:hypothetical protein